MLLVALFNSNPSHTINEAWHVLLLYHCFHQLLQHPRDKQLETSGAINHLDTS